LFLGETLGTIFRLKGHPFDELTAMHFPVPDFPPKPVAEPPALVRTVTREDVQWNRPVFKAPPLEHFLQALDTSIFAEEFRRVGLGPR
jgi:hypothetical protein